MNKADELKKKVDRAIKLIQSAAPRGGNRGFL